MAITSEKKKDLIKQNQKHKNDTGSPEVQVSILTERINNLTNHLNTSPHDYQGQKGLFKMVGERKRHLNYLKKSNIESYRKTLDHFDIRS